MSFQIKGKVALVTGGASGLGLQYAKELLRHGLKGVTIADINNNFGQKALEEINKEFGPNKAIFVVTDVADKKSFEEAFKKTIEQFKNIDILFNNAGILNDAIWEREIAININGTINGMLLGLENYIQKYKSGPDGLIINFSAINALAPSSPIPIYSATKSAIFSMSKAWGSDDHYQRTKIRVVCVLPGTTITPLITEVSGRNLGPPYENLIKEQSKKSGLPTQTPEIAAKLLMKLVENAKSGTVWIIEGGEEPYEYNLPPRESFKARK